MPSAIQFTLTSNSKKHGAVSADIGQIICITDSEGGDATELLSIIAGFREESFSEFIITSDLRLFGEVQSPELMRRLGVCFVSENARTQFSGLRSTCGGEVALTGEIRGMSSAHIHGALDLWLAALGLRNHRAADVLTLSGGQQQRLNIAAGLSYLPRVVLLDHAFTEIDEVGRLTTLSLLRQYLQAVQGVGIVTALPGELPPESFDVHIALPTTRGGNDIPPSLTSTEYSRKDLDLIVFDHVEYEFGCSEFGLADVSFSVSAGEISFLVGPNGAGKSTVGRLLLGMAKPRRGQVLLAGRPVENRRGRVELKIGYAPQDPSLILSRSSVVGELVEWRSNTIDSLRADVLEDLGLRQWFNAHPLDLPKGAQKRVSIAVAARKTANAFFLDEPTAYQDVRGVERSAIAMRTMANNGSAVLCATNDGRLLNLFPTARHIPIAPVALAPDRNHRRLALRGENWAPDVERSVYNEGALQVWHEITPIWLDNTGHTARFWQERIYPQLTALPLKSLLPPNVDVLDVGCGTGLNTLAFATYLESIGTTIRTISGVDANERLIRIARYLGSTRSRSEFFVQDIAAIENGNVLSKRRAASSDVVTSFFLFHDDPRLHNLIEYCSVALRPRGLLIALIIEPSWAQYLRGSFPGQFLEDEGVPQKHRGKDVYPIIEPSGDVMLVPHFSHDLHAYVTALEECGLHIEINTVFKPTEHASRSLECLDQTNRGLAQKDWVRIIVARKMP